MAHGSAQLGRFGGVTLVPDRHDDGTNVVRVPPSRLPLLLRPGVLRPPPGRVPSVSAWRCGSCGARSGLGRGRGRRHPGRVRPAGAPPTAVGATPPPRSARRRPRRPRRGQYRPRGARGGAGRGAHPDDMEFGCGATLAKWAAGGCRIHHLVLTDGAKGTWAPIRTWPSLVVGVRREQRDAADILAGGPAGRSASSTGPTVSCETGMVQRAGLPGDPARPPGRGPRARPVAAVPAPPRPPQRRLAPDRCGGGGPRSPVLR